MTSPRIERLSALVVNYDSGAFAVRCVRSLRDEWRASGRRASALEVVVVDNASPTDQGRYLAELAAEGARIVSNTENTGYSGGIELALLHSSGSAIDAVALLNPDLVFLEGSVEALLAALQPGVGAVGPRFSLDETGALLLPPIPAPTPREHTACELAAWSPCHARRYATDRSRRSHEHWGATSAFDTDMLSGACVFLRRETLPRLGALLDTRYPLYFEDADLCARLRNLGLRLVCEPRARVAHHWSRSVGAGGGAIGDAARRYVVSRRAFVERHFGARGLAREARLASLAAHSTLASRGRPFCEHIGLGVMSAAPSFDLSRRARFVLELALTPTYVLSAGIVGEGARAAIPERAWQWLFPGRYFVRVLEQDTLLELGAWSVDKHTASIAPADAPVDGRTERSA